MLRFHFQDGFADVEFASVPIDIYQNGIPCEAWWRKRRHPAYIVLNRKDMCEPSYIDIDETVDGEDINVFHGSLTGVEAVSFEQQFIDRFDCNFDEVAWLDDLRCAQDNECDNISHWKTVEVEVADAEDAPVCEQFFIQGTGRSPEKETNDISRTEFGDYIAQKYRNSIAERIAHYETACMDLCLQEFRRGLYLAGQAD